MKFPVHLGFSEYINSNQNHGYKIVNKLSHILQKHNLENPIVLTASKGVDKTFLSKLSKLNGIYFADDDEIISQISKEFDWFHKIKGYGKVRLLQYLLSIEGCAIRDQDTMEISETLLPLQFSSINTKVNGKTIAYVFSDYLGHTIPQIFDYETPLDLRFLIHEEVNPYFSEKKKRKMIKNSIIGNFVESTYTEESFDLVGWGNHGACCISKELFLNVPPIAGPIRAGDDSFPIRLLMANEDHTLTSHYLPNLAYHQMITGEIPRSYSIGEISNLVRTYLFSPMTNKIREVWAETNESNFENRSKKVAEKLVEGDFNDEFIKETKRLVNNVAKVFDKWSTSSDYIKQVVNSIHVDNLVQEAFETYDLTILLYKNWQDIYKTYNQDSVNMLKPLNKAPLS